MGRSLADMQRFSGGAWVLPRKATMEIRWYHTAAWEFSWICNISAERIFERHILAAASVSSTQDFFSSKKHTLLCDLCLIFFKESNLIMIKFDVIPLAFYIQLYCVVYVFSVESWLNIVKTHETITSK